MEFTTVKVSQNLNSMQKILTVKSNQMFDKVYEIFGNKSVTKNHWIQNKCIEYKLFELKCENTKLPNVWSFK